MNTYSGNFDKNFIPPMKDGAYEFIQELSKNYMIKIFTTRNKILTSKWLIENKLENFIEDITSVKELSHLFIDDRCINFNGNYPNLMNKIKEFKVWYKQL